MIWSVPKGEVVRIGHSASCDIVTEFRADARLYDGSLWLFSGSCEHNGKETDAKQIKLEVGDFVRIGTLTLTMKSRGIECSGSGFTVRLKELPPSIGTMDMEDFPEYKRPPRIVKRAEKRTIEITAPKAKEKPKKSQILKTALPPLIMVAMMAMTRMMNGGNIMMMLMSLGMAVSVVFSITSHFTEKKEREEDEQKRAKDYGEYLLGKRRELHAAKSAEEKARRYTHPSLGQIEELVDTLSSRIYERSAHDGDFLSISLGGANTLPEYEVKFREDEISSDKDELMLDAEAVVRNFRELSDMPLAVDLKHAHLGLVGEKELIHNELKGIIAELCFML